MGLARMNVETSEQQQLKGGAGEQTHSKMFSDSYDHNAQQHFHAMKGHHHSHSHAHLPQDFQIVGAAPGSAGAPGSSESGMLPSAQQLNAADKTVKDADTLVKDVQAAKSGTAGDAAPASPADAPAKPAAPADQAPAASADKAAAPAPASDSSPTSGVTNTLTSLLKQWTGTDDQSGNTDVLANQSTQNALAQAIAPTDNSNVSA